MSRNLARHARLALALPLALLVLLALPTLVSAHPLGNFTVNRYTRIEPGTDAIRLRYVIDMAEIPAFQELATIDTDRNGAVSEAEGAAYIERSLPQLVAGLHLTLDGKPAALRLVERRLSFPEGQGGLKTLRLEADLLAALPAGTKQVAAEYRDTNFAERLGWQEVVVRPSGVALLESSVPQADTSDELRGYPTDMLQSPLRTTAASFRFDLQAASGVAGGAAAPAVRGFDPRADDRFTALIASSDRSVSTALLAFAIAFGLGCAHALAPGHGKAIVAAYLVGSRGTVGHALFLGLTTTVTHTAGVFALGLLTLLISRFILPEQLYPYLGILSGMLVVGLGLTLFRGRLQALFRPGGDHAHSHGPGGHQHHGPWQDHGGAHDHSDLATLRTASPEPAITWRSLLALGVSGGLLPCPSALVVLLGAIALGRVGFGLLLIIAFSAGLASVLTAIGVLLVYAGKLIERVPAQGPLLRALPVASALLITIAGVGITVQAVSQAGLF